MVCLPLGWGFDLRTELYLLIVEVSRLPGLCLFLVLLRPRTLVFVVFALMTFLLSFLRSSASFGHPLYDAGCPKFLQFT